MGHRDLWGSRNFNVFISFDERTRTIRRRSGAVCAECAHGRRAREPRTTSRHLCGVPVGARAVTWRRRCAGLLHDGAEASFARAAALAGCGGEGRGSDGDSRTTAQPRSLLWGLLRWTAAVALVVFAAEMWKENSALKVSLASASMKAEESSRELEDLRR